MEKKIYHIVAQSDNSVIGRDNRLPWHFSEDMKHFKELTTNSTVIMGRKTYESIGRPLPNRENFVITGSAQNYPSKEHLQFYSSVEEAIKNAPTEKVFIIGGSSIYEQTINNINGIYLTQIHKNYSGDAFYPAIPPTFVKKSETSVTEQGVPIDFIYFENQGTATTKKS